MKKVLIPTALDSVAKQILEDHGGYAVVQVPKCDVLQLVRDNPDVHALIVRSEKITAEIIDAAPHLDEVQLDFAGVRLHVRRGGGAPALQAAPTAPAAAPSPAPATPAAAPAAAPPAARRTAHPPAPEGAIAIRAPMLGTFYRAPAPGEKPFVEVGGRVAAADTVCLIEVMKLFNSIAAGVDGTVVAIHADNGALVEFDQPLVYVMPDRRAA